MLSLAAAAPFALAAPEPVLHLLFTLLLNLLLSHLLWSLLLLLLLLLLLCYLFSCACIRSFVGQLFITCQSCSSWLCSCSCLLAACSNTMCCSCTAGICSNTFTSSPFCLCWLLLLLLLLPLLLLPLPQQLPFYILPAQLRQHELSTHHSRCPYIVLLLLLLLLLLLGAK
jgi:hypothetical protein